MPYLQRDSANIYYEDVGTGEPILMLHSLGTSSGLWQRQRDALRTRYRVITIDARLHGKTESDAPFSLTSCAADAAAVLHELEIEHAHVIGLSMGGHIAMELARTHPELLRSIALCNTFHTVREDIREERIEQRLKMLEQPDFEREWARISLHNDASEEEIEQTMRLFACTREQYREAWVKVMRVQYTEVLKNIRARTLVLTGDEDRSAPVPVAEQMHAMIPHSKLCILPNAGHLSNLSTPEAFLETIENFIKGDLY